jgi:hypothetical protein
MMTMEEWIQGFIDGKFLLGRTSEVWVQHHMDMNRESVENIRCWTMAFVSYERSEPVKSILN